MKSALHKKGRPSTVDSGPVLASFGHDLGLMCGLSLLSTIFLSLIFPPIEFWPLAFVGLAPWSVAVCRVTRPWMAHWGSFAFGWAYFLLNLKWLMPVTGLGYAALAFYLAIYWTLTAWAIRTGRRAGISPAWTLPVVWTSCELLRAWVITGFPWLYLSHALYKQVTFIQISDTIGAYGVTFIIALVNGALVELILRFWRPASEKSGRLTVWIGLAAALIAVGANLLYGRYRLNEADFKPGPRVAVIQEDFPLRSTAPYSDPMKVIFARYFALAAQAAQEKPDLLAFPETVWGSMQNIDFIEKPLQTPDDGSAFTWQYGKLCHEATSAFARGDYAAVNGVIARFENSLNAVGGDGRTRYELPRLPAEGGPPVALVVGSVALEKKSEEAYPREKKYNSALMYDPDGVQRRERFDKIHLVQFGEIVPFRNARCCGVDFHWLYRFLNRLSPFSYGGSVEYSLWPGESYTVFELNANGRTTRFGTPICYEDTLPYISRNYVWDGGARRVDFLVNLSNDGWFLYGAELPQHLAICVFRAVENRVSIARSVNTGISGFIDPNGRIISLVRNKDRTYGPGLVGYQITEMPIDGRKSCYGRLGDWFASLCLLGACVLWGGAIVTRWVFALRKRIAAWRIKKRTA